MRNVNREADAYRTLAQVFADSPDVILQKLVETATSFCGADSAGISLEQTADSGERVFRWVAISGSFAGFLGGTTPRFFSPCGTTLDSARPQLYRVTKTYYDLPRHPSRANYRRHSYSVGNRQHARNALVHLTPTARGV